MDMITNFGFSVLRTQLRLKWVERKRLFFPFFFNLWLILPNFQSFLPFLVHYTFEKSSKMAPNFRRKMGKIISKVAINQLLNGTSQNRKTESITICTAITLVYCRYLLCLLNSISIMCVGVQCALYT